MKPETKNKIFWTLVILGIVCFVWAILNRHYAIHLCIIGLVFMVSAIPFIVEENNSQESSNVTSGVANEVPVDNDVTTHPDIIKNGHNNKNK